MGRLFTGSLVDTFVSRLIGFMFLQDCGGQFYRFLFFLSLVTWLGESDCVQLSCGNILFSSLLFS